MYQTIVYQQATITVSDWITVGAQHTSTSLSGQEKKNKKKAFTMSDWITRVSDTEPDTFTVSDTRFLAVRIRFGILVLNGFWYPTRLTVSCRIPGNAHP